VNHYVVLLVLVVVVRAIVDTIVLILFVVPVNQVVYGFMIVGVVVIVHTTHRATGILDGIAQVTVMVTIVPVLLGVEFHVVLVEVVGIQEIVTLFLDVVVIHRGEYKWQDVKIIDIEEMHILLKYHVYLMKNYMVS